MALGFSKPVRLHKNRRAPQDPANVPPRTDLNGLGEKPQIGATGIRPTVLVTDDQALFRAGLARLQAADPHLTVVNTTGDDLDTVEQMLRLTPDIVLMDLQIPTAVNVDRSGAELESSTYKVVILAADIDHETLRAIRKNGSGGDLGQDLIPNGLVSRIQALYASKDRAAPAPRPEISKRELTVLSFVAAGRSNKQIGKLLGISEKTVRNHLSRIFHKLRANNRTEAVMNAVRIGLLTI